MKNFKSIQNLNIQKFIQIVSSGKIPFFCNISKNVLEFESCEWSEYWNCISNTPLFEDKSFQNFQECYLQYVQNQFSPSYCSSFCLTYWQFLRKILISFQELPLLYSEVLQAIAGFGTFGIGYSVENPIAAGVFNLTHPVYQTAKIQIPSRPESSKYLPLCTVYIPSKKKRLSLPEFYYYRQLALGLRKDARFLLFPAVNPEIRFSSFEILHSFTEKIHSKNDTRVQERASFLAPVIRATLQERTEKENSTFRVADIGSGTGHLFRNIIEKIENDFPHEFRDNSIEWTIVERSGMDYHRHLFHVNFFKKIHQIKYLRKSFLEWVESQKNDISGFSWDLVLMCRLFNNTSHFSVNWTDDGGDISKLLGKDGNIASWRNGVHSPIRAIRTNLKNLIATEGRISLKRGYSFRQPSFSNYFQAIYFCSEDYSRQEIPSDSIFFPLRQFGESSLLDASGESIFKTLLQISRNILIEDVDLSASFLKRHLSQHGLFPEVWDFTKLLHLTTSHVTLISQRKIQP